MWKERASYNLLPMPRSFRKFFELRERKPGSPAQVPAAGDKARTPSPCDTSLSNTIGDGSGNSLFAFVDLKDPFTPSEVAGEDLPGPILSVMASRQFDSLFLFHTPHTREKALATQYEVNNRYPNCRMYLRELPVSDPKDYSSVMARLAREVCDSIRQMHTHNNYVCVSSGTAEMRAAWFVLTIIGVLPAKLLQVGTPFRPLFGPANVKEVVDTSDWETIHDLLMPRIYDSPHYPSETWITRRLMEIARAPGTSWKQREEAVERSRFGRELHDGMVESHPGGTEKARSSVENAVDQDSIDRATGELGLVPGLESVLQELGIHVGSAVLRYAAERAGIAASSPLPVLLLGETGTGKERFAHLIHRLSPRASREMIAINCAAIPKELAESHLFGHVKGAFSGAVGDKKGVFEAADQSTLFLDELAELPPEIQAKLLRVIQDGSFQRVGSTNLLRVDVRIVAATNRDLKKEIAAGRFREDLYFRLEVVQIKLPALRDRRAEITELALAILRQINERRLKPRQLSKSALLRLESYDWPGNVRELSNVLERSVLYASTEILEPDDLLITEHQRANDPFLSLPEPVEGFSLEQYLGQVRKQLILRALSISKGNQSRAASLLHISKQAVHKFLTGQPDNRS
jgi:DNA-binding NtrC family response regulator